MTMAWCWLIQRDSGLSGAEIWQRTLAAGRPGGRSACAALVVGSGGTDCIWPGGGTLITVFGAQLNAEEVIGRAHNLLKVMELELGKTAYLAGEEPTIADVSAYSYIAHAPEGNVSLDDYANVRAWLTRIEALPGFVAMPRTVAGLQKTA